MKKLKDSVYRTIMENTPLVSIDFLIKNDGKILLGKRKNEPAKDYFFKVFHKGCLFFWI